LFLTDYEIYYIFLPITRVVTGRRATPSASEGIEDGAKVAIFSQLFVTASTFRVDALVELSRWRGSWGKMI